MIYLPNSFERYTAGLRIIIHLSVLRHGLCRRHLDSLKKIYIAEALFAKDSLLPYSLAELSLPLLSSSQILLEEKGEFIDFSLSGDGVYLLNKRLFTLLLLQLCLDGSSIRLYAKEQKIVISFCGEIKNSLSFIKAMKGCYFYEKFSQKAAIVLPARKCSEKPQECENEWHYIFDRFSPVNLYFG